jgi:hypothetical protein
MQDLTPLPRQARPRQCASPSSILFRLHRHLSESYIGNLASHIKPPVEPLTLGHWQKYVLVLGGTSGESSCRKNVIAHLSDETGSIRKGPDKWASDILWSVFIPYSCLDGYGRSCRAVSKS